MKKILSSFDNNNLMNSKKMKFNQNSMRSGSENEEIGYEINQSSEINNLITISSTNNNNLYFKNNNNINNNNNNNNKENNLDLTPSRNLMSNIKRKKIQIETDETNFNTNKNISTTNNNNNNIIINNLTNKLNTISTLNNINSNKNNNNYLNKINELNNIISDLLNYKNLCENFIKILIPNKIFPINEKDLIDYKSFNLNNNENEKILEEQILINNEQKNYIEILKQTIESELIKNELNFSKEKNENNNNNKIDILIEFTKLKIENEKIKKDLILEQAVLIELKSEFESLKKLNDELKEKNEFLENNKNNEIIINNSNIEKLKIENQNQKNLLENQIKLFEEEQKKKKDF